ncbi:PTS cellobiose transporter subunit IIA [Pullulanibacillus camelliae]|uniref:PTS cellobiose transporter subunit IIA n=1 Tax=Pullulanibacillus camelliae TaxID=1707096 RepID=A0A8J2YLP9_9BACL|nr:PTS lactose/cellobiose transporter subunit IIA [Pullulanibacillus camelliae]GGE52499.1 PTS cellobiose transporter subunit IIA [Pullulanibacillus camelliae]
MSLEEQAMRLILFAGDAKCLCQEAITIAKKEEFTRALDLLEEARIHLLKAHNIQTQLISEEAKGISMDINLILIHAEDHLMNAINFRDMAVEHIQLYQEMNDLKREVEKLKCLK